MAILSYNEILKGSVIDYNNEPYEVLSAHIFRMQQRKPVNQTKLRHLVSGKVVDISFHQNESVEEADINTMKALYLYTNKKESWFAEDGNPKNRFFFPDGVVHDRVQWLTQNAPVDVLVYEDRPMSIKIPVKVDLEVIESPPAVKGNTVSGGTKLAKLSTGVSVNVPLFINVGDVVRINTDSGEYTERVSKS